MSGFLLGAVMIELTTQIHTILKLTSQHKHGTFQQADENYSFSLLHGLSE
jgi:hypothetical protein